MRKLLLVLVIFVASCATTNTHSAQNTTQKIDFNLDAKKVYTVALQTAMEMNWEISMSDSESLAFSAKTPKEMNRWDDIVNIFIVVSDTSSVLTVKSKLGHAPNVEYIKSYLQKVSMKLTN